MISVITVNYNNSKGLERTLESVERQENADFEYIVVDGDSNDGSVELIKKHIVKINKAIVEKDRGTFDAMNKGTKAASGEYLLFLNSGDILAGVNSLARAGAYLIDKDIYYGDAVFSRRNREWLQKFPEDIDLDYLMTHALNHQNTFIKRSFLLAEGGYDNAYKVISDWGLMVKAFLNGSPTYKHIPEAIAVYFLNGISSAPSSRSLILSEKKKFLEALDPACGKILYKYIELCESDYYKILSRFKDKRAFERLISIPLLASKILARIGM